MTTPSASGRGPAQAPVASTTDGAVHLVEVGERAAGGEVVEHPVEVVGQRGGVVAAEREVERVVRRAADPAEPVGEGQVDGAEGVPEGVHPATSGSRARPARRRRRRAGAAPTAGPAAAPTAGPTGEPTARTASSRTARARALPGSTRAASGWWRGPRSARTPESGSRRSGSRRAARVSSWLGVGRASLRSVAFSSRRLGWPPSKPAAITVTRTSSPSASSMVAPKMMLASGWADSATRAAASLISNRPRSEPPAIESRTP